MSEQERVVQTVNRLARLRPVVERSMEDAWGQDWVDERRRRAEEQGRQISLTSGPHDPRFLLACIAFEEPLAIIFSLEDREQARVLTTTANSAYHHDLDRLRPGDGDKATRTVERLLAVGLGIDRAPDSGPDGHGAPVAAGQPSAGRLNVGVAIERAKAAATAEQERQERAAQEEAEHFEQHIERVGRLRRVLSTFSQVMRVAGNPGATTVENPMIDRRTWRFGRETRTSSGWLMAAAEGEGLSFRTEEGEPDQGYSCFLSTDGNLWLSFDYWGEPISITGRFDVDDLESHPADSRPAGDAPFGTPGSFYGAWGPGRSQTFPSGADSDLDEAIIARIGELCVEHGIAWPDIDAGAEEEALERDQ